MIRISKFATSIKPAATLAAGAKARALKAQGIKVLDFSIGEPDFDTPKHICEAAAEAVKKGHTHYTAVSGIPELKSALVKWYKKHYNYDITPDMVVVSNGAKQSLHNVLASSLNPGDEVIIPTPYWVSYSDLVSMTGAIPVMVNTTPASGFKLTPQQLKDAITPNTRMLMLNSPCNPSGTVYKRAELEALAELFLSNTDGTILSDEIYEQLMYDGATPTCVATLKPQYRDRVVTVSGASKSFAMTGWRMGWTIGPAALCKAIDTVQGQETSCPSSISQYATVTALESPETAVSVAAMLKEFTERRKVVIEKLNATPGVKLHVPEGAFYAFFDVSSYFGKKFKDVTVTDSQSFCSALLEQAHVNMIQGSAFGTEGYVRMSFATNIDTIRAGLSQFQEWLATGK